MEVRRRLGFGNNWFIVFSTSLRSLTHLHSISKHSFF